MEVFVDDNLLDAAFVGDDTVEDVLRHVQLNLCPDGRMVTGIRCDGEEVNSDAIPNTLRKPASAFERIEVFVDTKGALVADAMSQAAVSLRQTEAACEQVAGLLTEGKTAEGIKALSACVGAWQQIHEAVAKSIQMLELDIERIMINDHPLIDVIKKPKDVLVQIRDALQAKDHVLLADVLQYELEEVLRQWQTIVARIREEAEEVQASAG